MFLPIEDCEPLKVSTAGADLRHHPDAPSITEGVHHRLHQSADVESALVDRSLKELNGRSRGIGGRLEGNVVKGYDASNIVLHSIMVHNLIGSNPLPSNCREGSMEGSEVGVL